MRFRLRTLLLVVTVVAVIAAISGSILNAYRPIVMWRSRDGVLAINQFTAAQLVSVEVYVDGTKINCDLSPDSRQALLAWLIKGVRDIHPAKRTVLGEIGLKSPKAENWIVLEMNRDELSVQTSHGTWRSLDRAEFLRIARPCQIEDN